MPPFKLIIVAPNVLDKPLPLAPAWRDVEHPLFPVPLLQHEAAALSDRGLLFKRPSHVDQVPEARVTLESEVAPRGRDPEADLGTFSVYVDDDGLGIDAVEARVCAAEG